MKKIIGLFLSAALIAASLSACSGSSNSSSQNSSDQSSASSNASAQNNDANADFPTKDFQGTVMWSAGGVNDSVSRAIAPFTPLGDSSIVFTNRPGAGGGISTQYVHEQPADGYNLLFGAENPQIAKVMNTSELDYSNFIPINIFSTSVGVLLVAPDSPYNSAQDLIDDMLSRPGEVNMATTGPGGLPFTVNAMMSSVSGTQSNMVTYDGEAGCTTAVMGGHSDYTITTLGSCAELVKSGELKALAVFHNDTIEGFEEISPITTEIPDYDKFLPWGPFYGVFVKEGTPDDVVQYLTDAFAQGATNEEYREILKNLGCQPANISGAEAREYVDKYRSVSSYLLQEAGAAVVSPEDAGISPVE